MATWLKQSTAVDVLIGPAVDATDGVTPETALTLDVELSKNGQALADKHDATAPVHDGAGTIDGYYNCELDDTDTDTLGSLVLVAYASGALQIRHEFMVVPANVWDSLFSTDHLQVDTVEVSGDATAADNLEIAYDSMLTGTAQAGAAGTVTLASGASATDNLYNGMTVVILSGTGAGQSRQVYDYTGSTKVANVSPNWTTNPSSDSVYILVQTPPASTEAPVAANVTQLGGAAQSLTDLKDFADTGYAPDTHKVAGVVLTDTCTTNTDMRGTDSAATAANLAVVDGIVDTIVARVIGTIAAGTHNPQSGDAFARLGAPAGDSVSADVAALPTAVENADAILGRNIAGGSSTGRTVTSALRKLRNKVAIAAGTMTVYAEDDSTPDHTEVVVTAAGNPIISTDPA